MTYKHFKEISKDYALSASFRDAMRKAYTAGQPYAETHSLTDDDERFCDYYGYKHKKIKNKHRISL